MAAIVATPRMRAYRTEQEQLGRRIAASAGALVEEHLDPFNPDRGWARLLAELIALIRGGRSISEELAMAFYRHLREMEEVEGQEPPSPNVPFPENAVVGSMIYTGPRMAKAIGRRERSASGPEIAQRVGVMVGRSAMRHTLNAGRRVIQGTVLRDEYAVGWARITDSDPCDFCRMLATRGPVYKSARTAGRTDLHRYHDGCACSVVPLFRTPENLGARQIEAPGRRRRGSQQQSRSRRGPDGMTDRQRAVVEQVRREVGL
jgi:hypothetical protein